MRLLFCALILILFIGCDAGPARIDGSSDAAFKSSVQKVKAGLSPEKIKEFDEAAARIGGESLFNSGAKIGAPLAEVQKQLLQSLHGKTADEVIAEGQKIKASHAAD